MKCPFCGEEDTRVIDSRPADEGSSIRRRRQCDKCRKRFTTYEKVEAIPLVVIKKDMTREPYDRSKIERGVFRSCHKRPVSVSKMNAMIDKIEADIFNREANGGNKQLYWRTGNESFRRIGCSCLCAICIDLPRI